MSDPRTDFVVEASARLAGQGFPRVPAGVLMALMATDDGRLGAAELAERLQVSAGAISGAVRYLALLGFVHVATVPGTRRHVYALPDSPWYAESFTNSARFRELARMVQGHVDRMPPGSGAARRIGEMADFFRFLDDRLPALLDEWHARRG